ncbi:MAG: hypothetical protein V2I35_09610, partial [Desulfocapsaceae bacterium]|nr:hypothetical protein [Desulfocapsaceae bacterium]
MQTQQTLLTILTVLLSFFSTSHDATADDAPETLTEVSISRLEATFTGDYDALVKDRRIIRVLIPHSR